MRRKRKKRRQKENLRSAKDKRLHLFCKAVASAFDADTLALRCKATITELLHELGDVRGKPGDQHAVRENGSPVLAVAHLDTVQKAATFCEAPDVAGETLYFSPRLDDRLGVYTILDLLPKLGVCLDVLFTENEEIGQSTAVDFETAKEYRWIVEFDRSGTDAVTYEYDWPDGTLEKYFTTAFGTFSDICYLEHLGVNGFNVGIAYHNEHSTRAFFVLQDYITQIARFLMFYEDHKGTRYPHIPAPVTSWGYGWNGALFANDPPVWSKDSDFDGMDQCDGCDFYFDSEELVETPDGKFCEDCRDALADIIDTYATTSARCYWCEAPLKSTIIMLDGKYVCEACAMLLENHNTKTRRRAR